jgi:hypothetical protein
MDHERILGGANFVEEIAEGIGKADVFMPLISKKSIGSKWVKLEVYHALNKNKKIVPLLVDFTELPNDFQLVLGNLQYVDFSGQNSKQNPWTKLQDSLSAKASPEFRVEIAGEEKNAYEDLYKYLSDRAKQPVPLWVLAIAVLFVIFAAYFLIPSKTILPKPDKFDFSEFAPEINNVLKLTHTTPLKRPDIRAAAAIFAGSKNEPVSRWAFLQNGQSLSGRDRYFILMRSEQECYFYVFQIDSTGKLDWLFPANNFNRESSGKNPVFQGKTIKVPPDDRAFYLDENKGVEHIYVVATPEPWQELETALSTAAQVKPPEKPILASLEFQTARNCRH